MVKAGSVYKKLVADVVGLMSPGAKVQYGQWILGRDGRRDLDVEIRGQINGEDQFVVIECKDWGNPVGIGVVDALDSKRRDIDADYALICSNSGFTSDALRKGKRVGIGMVAVLKVGDQNVKVVIEEEIYTKEIILEDCKTTCHFPDKSSISKIPKSYTANDVSYGGLPVVNWVAEKYIALVGSNPNAKQIKAFYKFKEPIFFDFSSVNLLVYAYEISLKIKSTWMSQVVSIDASVGIYDFIHHKAIMPPGQQQYTLKGVDFDKWKPIDFIPIEKPLELNENRVSLSLMKNSIDKIEGVGTPNIDSWVNETILTVDGNIAKRGKRSLKEDGTKPASGIEMLVNPIQGERIKLGRNEPCYCGSGKKYKKCHGFL